jgi:hypothetical protein
MGDGRADALSCWLAILRGMKLRLRVSVRNALLLTFWASVWCANIAAVDRYDEIDRVWAYNLYLGLVVAPPAAAVGIICGHPRTGILCGITSACALIWGADILNAAVPP